MADKIDAAIEAAAEPAAQIVIAFSGTDGLTINIRATKLNTAQWAVAALNIGLHAQQALATAMAAAASQQIVAASAMPNIGAVANLAEIMRRGGRS